MTIWERLDIEPTHDEEPYEDSSNHADNWVSPEVETYFDEFLKYRLFVEYYFRKSQYDLAVDVLTKILQLQPDDIIRDE